MSKFLCGHNPPSDTCVYCEIERLRAEIETLNRERYRILGQITGVTRDGVDPLVVRLRFKTQEDAEEFIGAVYDTVVLGKGGAA